jgi:hypothetical protein
VDNTKDTGGPTGKGMHFVGLVNTKDAEENYRKPVPLKSARAFDTIYAFSNTIFPRAVLNEPVHQ